jgi:hypothetical protein
MMGPYTNSNRPRKCSARVRYLKPTDNIVVEVGMNEWVGRIPWQTQICDQDDARNDYQSRTELKARVLDVDNSQEPYGVAG